MTQPRASAAGEVEGEAEGQVEGLAMRPPALRTSSSNASAASVGAGVNGAAPSPAAPSKLAADVLRTAEKQQLQRQEQAQVERDLIRQQQVEQESLRSLPKRVIASVLNDSPTAERMPQAPGGPATDSTDTVSSSSAASVGAGAAVVGGEAPLERRHKRSIVYCALCFFMLFTAWSPAQSYTTTVQPEFGPWSIILIYVFLGSFGLLAPLLINRMGVRVAFIVSSAMYAMYMLGLASGSPALLGVGACLVGAGGGVLWVNQGMFVKAIAAEAGGHVGYLTGLWFSVYSFAPLTGNTLAGLLLTAGLSLTALLLVLACIAGTASVMFLAVRSPPIDPKSIAPLSQKLRDVRSVIRERAMHALMLWMAAQGLAQSFQFAIFPSMVSHAAGSNGSSSHIAYIMALYGVMAISVSYIAGKAIDTRGWRWVMYPYQIDLFIGYFVCALGGLMTPDARTIVEADGSTSTFYAGNAQALIFYYCCGILFGISDALVQVLINATVVLWYGKTASNSAAAFATYRVTGSATWVLGVAIRLLTSALGAGIATIVLATIAFTNFWYYQTRVRPGELALAQLHQQQQQEADLERQEREHPAAARVKPPPPSNSRIQGNVLPTDPPAFLPMDSEPEPMPALVQKETES